MEKRQHSEYYEALERLDKNKPIRLPKGTRVNKSNVELEAGRTKGAIKSGRKGFELLINAIEEVKARQSAPKKKASETIKKYKDLSESYKKKYLEALGRELVLVERLEELENALVEIREKNI